MGKKKKEEKQEEEAKYGEELVEVVDEVAKGFDRGVKFIEIKDKLVDDFNNKIEKIRELKPQNPGLKPSSEFRYLVNKTNYTLIAMIQLRNGSRISEACVSYRNWMAGKGIDEKITVKIAKSARKLDEENTTKARYRQMIFPDWVDADDFKFLKRLRVTKKLQKCKTLKKRTLDYLRKYYDCNTHSLRYAFINYMLYEKKHEPSLISKFVGHVNLSQIVRYTQLKSIESLFEEEI